MVRFEIFSNSSRFLDLNKASFSGTKHSVDSTACFVFLNPIALRKAKIIYNFGLSECNRANCVEWSPFYIHTCDTSLITLETSGNEPQNSSKIYHFLPKF